MLQPQQAQPPIQPQPPQPNQQANPAQGAMPDAKPESDYDTDIITNLQHHLDNIPDTMKEYLVKNLDENSITILGIVAGQEVYDYFVDIYQNQIAPQKPQQGALPNSPTQGDTGSQPEQMAQAKATPNPAQAAPKIMPMMQG